MALGAGRLERWGAAAGLVTWAAVALPPLVARFSSELLALQLEAGATASVLDGGYGVSSVFLIINAAAAVLLLPLRLTGTIVAANPSD